MNKMSPNDRARQFLPFDALKGLREAIKIKDYEHERLKKKDISEGKMNEMSKILINLERNDVIEITYFIDGVYKKIKGCAKIKLDENIIIVNKEKINFDDIYDIKLEG